MAALKLPAGKTPGEAGALVASVEPESPAAKAGLQPGDVITAVNGKTVANPRDLAVDVAAVPPGSQTRIDVIRDGAMQTVTADVATLPSEQGTAQAGSAQDQKESVGLALAPLSPDARQELNIPERMHGVVVAEVRPGSAADAAGIQQGDVIVGVGTQNVASPQQAVHAIHEAVHGNHAVALRIFRDGHAAFVAIDMSKANTEG